MDVSDKCQRLRWPGSDCSRRKDHGQVFSRHPSVLGLHNTKMISNAGNVNHEIVASFKTMA